MRKRTVDAIVAVAVPLLAAAAAVPLLGGSASAQPAPVTATPDPYQSDWPNQDRLSQAAKAATSLGERYPSVYAGVELDLPTDVLIVHRVRGIADTDAFDQAVRDNVRAVAGPSRIMIKDAPYSQAQLYGWVATLQDDRGYWQARGIGGYSLVAGPGGDCVQVGLSNPERDGDTVRNHYTFPICLGEQLRRVA